MIINRNESEVTVLGEVQKHKVGIDEKNINHIVTILSSNLYSHPMQSFLREIVSNAVDSHIEAGVEEPIIITITDNDLSIRDFGTGISHKRFEEIFLNIGSSTKRDSNEYIGSFGIGRFSSLAVADVVNITSFYNGKAYYYVMNKDIDQLHIDLILEKDTDEHNGVEVKIPLTPLLDYKDWACLYFINNIYIEDERKYCSSSQRDIISAFNKRKVYSYNSFKAIDIFSSYREDSHPKVLVGNIPYTVDYDILWNNDRNYTSWEETFKTVYPTVNIGDVDITPNRENLLYSERTKKTLCEAYKNAIDELTKLWNDYCSEEKTDFMDYLFIVYMHWKNKLPLNDKITVPISSNLPFSVSYKDLPEYDFKRTEAIVRSLLCYQTDSIIAFLKHNEWKKGKSQLQTTVRDLFERYNKQQGVTTIIVPTSYGFSSKYIKGFLTEKYGDKVLILKKPYISVSKIRYFIQNCYGITTLSNSKEVHFIICCIRELLKYFGQRSIQLDIINSADYQEYKERNKENINPVRNTTKMQFYVWYSGTGTGQAKVMSFTPKDLMDTLSSKNRYSKKRRIVYSQLNNPFINGFVHINYPNLTIIGLSQENYTLAEKGLFPDYVRPIEELYSADNRVLQKIATAEYLRYKIFSLPSAFPKLARKIASKLTNYVSTYPHNYNDYTCTDAYDLLRIIPEEKYDRKAMGLYHMVEKYFEIYRKIKNEDFGKFQYYLIMKAKKLRLDYDYYNNIKKEINYINNLL